VPGLGLQRSGEPRTQSLAIGCAVSYLRSRDSSSARSAVSAVPSPSQKIARLQRRKRTSGVSTGAGRGLDHARCSDAAQRQPQAIALGPVRWRPRYGHYDRERSTTMEIAHQFVQPLPIEDAALRVPGLGVRTEVEGKFRGDGTKAQSTWRTGSHSGSWNASTMASGEGERQRQQSWKLDLARWRSDHRPCPGNAQGEGERRGCEVR
jgi:hypothetical protein